MLSSWHEKVWILFTKVVVTQSKKEQKVSFQCKVMKSDKTFSPWSTLSSSPAGCARSSAKRSLLFAFLIYENS